uniref:Uncharacterized protein n=1 Tax=Cacopsylla melanoneura TaxID=428564 RepID=A0A8D8Z458_9HEMI
MRPYQRARTLLTRSTTRPMPPAVTSAVVPLFTTITTKTQTKKLNEIKSAVSSIFTTTVKTRQWTVENSAVTTPRWTTKIEPKIQRKSTATRFTITNRKRTINEFSDETPLIVETQIAIKHTR